MLSIADSPLLPLSVCSGYCKGERGGTKRGGTVKVSELVLSELVLREVVE